MVKETSRKYKNIRAECIMMYLSLYITCIKKSKVPKKCLFVMPMIFRMMNSRAQVDLVDMQNQANGQMNPYQDHLTKWLLVYQDHLT